MRILLRPWSRVLRWLTLSVSAQYTLASCGDGVPAITPEGVHPLILPQVNPLRAVAADVFVLAHEDDDLLFMNPDIQDAIAAGSRVLAIYLTAGNAGRDSNYWERREAGMRDAYAWAAGEPNDWRRQEIEIDGHTIHIAALDRTATASQPEAPIELVFLRLPDGNPRGHGFARNNYESLAKLWAGTIDQMHPVDGAPAFTRRQLEVTLQALMQRGLTGASTGAVHLLDCTSNNRQEHYDHHFAALFGLQAQRAVALDRDVYVSLGLASAHQPDNLDAALTAAKWQMFLHYARHDPLVCTINAQPCMNQRIYYQMASRHYLLVSPLGTWQVQGDSCVPASR